VRRLLGLGSFKSVQVFHALSEKNGAALGNRELAEQFDYLFLLNRRAYRYYERLGMPAERMRLVGFGKLDALVRGRVETVSLAKKLGINGRPVVLYAPTWEFVNESPDLLEGVVHNLGRVNAKALVKFHDLTYRHYEGSGFLDRLQQQNRSVSFVREEDSSRCLALADLLISDVSSIAYEYLVLDRPVVFVETPEMIRRFAAKEMGLEIEMRYCGHIVQALDGLPALVESCLANPKEKAGARREVSEEVLFKPGTAVDRATEEIYSLLGTEKPGTAIVNWL
jgi:CDP-glycerol glycerophosphotransferase